MEGEKKRINMKNEGMGDCIQLLMMTAGLFCTLPMDIIINILARLPLKELSVCRWVCKGWLNLICQPHFAKAHYHMQMQNRFYPYIVLFNRFKQLYLVDNVVFDDSVRSAVFGRQLNVLSKEYESSLDTVVDSVNGLMCFSPSLYVSSSYYICNPITGESITLPKSPKHKIAPLGTVLGFASTAVEYKFIRFLLEIEDGRQKASAEIYTLGSDRWRSIEDIPCIILRRWDMLLPDTERVLINENFYWIAFNPQTKSLCVFSFNVGTEEFTIIKPPIDTKPEAEENYKCICFMALNTTKYKLDVSRERLCFIDNSVADRIAIWVMENEGAQQCWAKLLSLEEEVLGKLCCGYYDVNKLAQGEFRVDRGMVERHLYYYNYVKKQPAKRVDLGEDFCIEDIQRPIILQPTLFSPKIVYKPS